MAVLSWWHVAFILACISPATTEVFAPSMRYADVDDSTSDEVSTALFVGLAAAMHIVHGYVADRCGVVVLALGGLALYVTSSLAIGFGVGSEFGRDVFFVSMRVLQGIGASACTVASLACVHTYLDAVVDVPTMYTARAYVLVIAPASSEFVCSLADDWHAAFVLMGVGGALSFVIVALGSRSSLVACGDRTVARRVSLWLSRKLRTFEWRRLRSTQAECEPEGQARPPSEARTHSDVAESQRPALGLGTAEAAATTRLVSYTTWVVVDALGFGAMFVWIAYAPLLEDVEYFGYMYSLTFVGSVVGSAIAQSWRTTRHVASFVAATSIQLCVAALSYVLHLVQPERLLSSDDTDDVRSLASAFTWTTFVLMTLSNGARAVAASHATACAMQAARTKFSAGHASSVFHSIRMGVTCCMLVAALGVSPWLVIVHALAAALLVMYIV